MSEEIGNPAVTVPRSIMVSIILNGALGFAILLATLFGIVDLEAVLNSPTDIPYIEVFVQATGSISAATAMASIVTALAIAATIGFVATSSRMMWSFARDQGLPFSNFLSKVEKRTSIPIYAVAVTTILACLLALINLGSSTVLNDVLSLAIAGFYATYFIASFLLLYSRCTKAIQPASTGSFSSSTVDPRTGDFRLVWGPWRVPGVWGIVNNVFACVYLLVIWFFSFWPPTNPTTPSTMNYSSLVAGGVVLFSVFYYFVWGRKGYRGPTIEIDHGR